VLTNLSRTVLFEISDADDVINVADIINRADNATPDRPMVNLITLILGLAVLPTEEHQVRQQQQQQQQQQQEPVQDHKSLPPPLQEQGRHRDEGGRPRVPGPERGERIEGPMTRSRVARGAATWQLDNQDVAHDPDGCGTGERRLSQVKCSSLTCAWIDSALQPSHRTPDRGPVRLRFRWLSPPPAPATP